MLVRIRRLRLCCGTTAAVGVALLLVLFLFGASAQSAVQSEAASSNNNSADDDDGGGDKGNGNNTSDNSLVSMLQAQLAAAEEEDEMSGSGGGGGGGGLVWRDLQVATAKHADHHLPHHHNHYHPHTTTTPTLVQKTSGVLRNGELTGLLGPSGSGKSTLLAALAGRSHPLHVRGFVGSYSYSNNCDNSTTRTTTTSDDVNVLVHSVVSPKQVAWLQQQDVFFTQLTVQETLELAAFLELPNMSAHDRRVLVQQTCSQLGLQHALHRPVGDPSSSSATTTTAFTFLMSLVPKWLQQQFRSNRNKNKRRNIPATTKGGSGGRLSGGERRRLSVALELLTANKQLLLVADEPTTGLDSAYSATVMKLLKDLSVQRHIPALCSLHQPRSSIWNSLDAVILMAPGGRVCYAGRRDAAVAYFANIVGGEGYVLPAHTNPAEFLVDLVSTDSEDPVKAAADEARIERLAAAFAAHQREQWTNAAAVSHHRRKRHPKNMVVTVTSSSLADVQQETGSSTSMHGQAGAAANAAPPQRSMLLSFRWIVPRRLGALWKRSWRQNVRDSNLNIVRLIMSVGNAVLLAGIFPTVRGPVPLVNSIADRVALLSFGAINLCMIAYMKAVTLFAQERPVVRREQTRENYSVLEYLIAKVLAELPLDAAFSAVFSTVLKHCTGLQISWKQLTAVFSLLTTAGASLGFLIGSVAPSDQYAAAAGIPVLVILMVVGIINPSGVDPDTPQPRLLSFFKLVSPFAFAIEALCLGEYPGVKYAQGKGGGFFSKLKNAPRMGGLALISTGDQVVEALGLKGHTYAGAMKHLGLISVGNLLFSWFGLLLKQRQQHRVQDNHKMKVSTTNRKRSSPHEIEDSSTTSSQANSPMRIQARPRL